MKHLLWIAIVAVALTVASAARAQAPNRDQEPVCVGILGAVQRPGVYAFDATMPRLGDLLEAAGGPLDCASGNVRIFRGRSVRSGTNLIAGRELELADGVLIVVDGSAGPQQAGPPPSTPRAGGTEASGRASANLPTALAPRDGVTVGVLGVYRTPALVRLSQEAGVGGLLRELGLAADSEGWVTLHHERAAPRRWPLESARAERVEDRDVLIFDLPAQARLVSSPPGLLTAAEETAADTDLVADAGGPMGDGATPADQRQSAPPSNAGAAAARGSSPSLEQPAGPVPSGVRAPALRPVPQQRGDAMLSERDGGSAHGAGGRGRIPSGARTGDDREEGQRSHVLRWAPWVCLAIFVACLIASRGWFRRKARGEAASDDRSTAQDQGSAAVSIPASSRGDHRPSVGCARPRGEPVARGSAAAVGDRMVPDAPAQAMDRSAEPPIPIVRPLRSPLTGRILVQSAGSAALDEDEEEGLAAEAAASPSPAVARGGSRGSIGQPVRAARKATSGVASHLSSGRPLTVGAALGRIAALSNGGGEPGRPSAAGIAPTSLVDPVERPVPLSTRREDGPIDGVRTPHFARLRRKGAP